MGSVISEEVCPECGFTEAVMDFYYKTGEYYLFCNRCGYAEECCGGQIKKKRAIGSWFIMFGGIGGSGQILEEKQRKAIEKDWKNGKLVNGNNKKATRVTYTFKKKNRWYRRDVIRNTEEVVGNKSIQTTIK